MDLARWCWSGRSSTMLPATLIALAGEHLRARCVLRPPVETLVRMIATARAEAHRHIDELLANQLDAGTPARIGLAAGWGHRAVQ